MNADGLALGFNGVGVINPETAADPLMAEVLEHFALWYLFTTATPHGMASELRVKFLVHLIEAWEWDGEP
jgi:hypothetical protein